MRHASTVRHGWLALGVLLMLSPSARAEGETVEVKGTLATENGRPALKDADGKIVTIHESLSLSAAEVTKDSKVSMTAKVYEYRGEKYYLLQGPPAESDPSLIPEGTKIDIQGEVTIGKGRPWIRVTTGPYAGKEFTILENKALEDWENGNQVNEVSKKDAANPEAAADTQPGAVYEEFTSYGTYKVAGRFCGTVTQHYGKNYFLIEPCPAPKKKGGGGKGGKGGKGRKGGGGKGGGY